PPPPLPPPLPLHAALPSPRVPRVTAAEQPRSNEQTLRAISHNPHAALQWPEYISPHANRRARSPRVPDLVPHAALEQNRAAKRLAGPHAARAARLDRQCARRAAGDHHAERRAVLAARGGHALARRPADTFDDLKYYTAQVAPALAASGIQ